MKLWNIEGEAVPNSDRLLWPYPSASDDPWYEKFVSLVKAQDASAYASREDRQTILGGGSTLYFNTLWLMIGPPLLLGPIHDA